MIVLIQPMYSKAELNGDSNYVMYSAFVRAMLRVRPSWHFLVLWPDDKSGYKYEPDGFFHLPNITRVPQRISTRKMANAISYDAGYYDTLMRAVGVDLVWCHLVEIAGLLKQAGDHPYAAAAMPVVVAAHHYVIHDSLPYPFEPQAHIAWAQLGGSLLADHNVFNSQHTRRMFVETAQRWLNDSAIAQVLQRSSTLGEGTLESSLRPTKRANDVPIIIYNHRLQGYKNYKETFALLDELYAEGVKFRVRFTNSSSENTAAIAGRPYVEIKLCARREQYLKVLAEGDLNVTNSQHETFCLSAIESMAVGQCLIAPDGVTFPEITGREANGYPYLFKSRDEQKAMLKRLLSDAAERRRWGAVLSSHVRTAYAQQTWAEQYAALFEKLQPALAQTSPDALQLIQSRLREHSGSTLRELYSKVIGVRVGDRVPFGPQSLPLVKLLRIVRSLGGRVVFERGEQRVYAK